MYAPRRPGPPPRGKRAGVARRIMESDRPADQESAERVARVIHERLRAENTRQKKKDS